MNQNRKLVLLAGAALSIATSAFAQTANQDRAYSAELLSDAGARVSMLAADGSGYNKDGFMIGSSDGNNSLFVFGSAQIRYYANFRDEPEDSVDNESFTHGFENRLTRLGVRGTIWDKAFGYQVRGQFQNEGTFQLESAFATYNWDNGFGIKAGQFKHPIFRESLVDNEYQLAVERSVTEGLFGGGYSQGIQFTYASDAFRAWFGFTDGLNSKNTPFNSGVSRTFLGDAGEADYALNARGEFKVMGSGWERFDDFTSWRSADDNGLIIGAAIHWQDSGSTGGTGGLDGNGDPVPGLSNLTYTVDAQFEGQGWNAFAAFLGTLRDSDAEGSDSTHDFGGVAQLGVFVTDQVELFARWDGVFFDDRGEDEIEDLHFITAGFNYYISPESHAVKLTGDVVWSINESNGLFGSSTDPEGPASVFGSNTNYGLLGSAEDGEIAARLQLQVVY